MRRGARSARSRVCLPCGGGGEDVAKARPIRAIEFGRVRRRAQVGEAPGRLGAGFALLAVIVVWLAVVPFATLVFLALHLVSALRGNERLRSPRREV